MLFVKNKSPSQIYLILIILIFLIPYNVVKAQNIDSLRGPDVVDISGRKYYSAVKVALDNAKESISMVMLRLCDTIKLSFGWKYFETNRS